MLFILYAGPVPFKVLIGAVTGMALAEFYTIGLDPWRAPERWSALLGGVLFGGAVGVGQPLLAGGVLTLLFLGLSLVFLLRFGTLERVTAELGVVLLGLLYLPLLLGHLMLLRELPFGREWIFLVLLIAMSGDTAAYFVGSSLGRSKLYPAISPNKSREGAAGGLAGSVAGALVAKAWFFSQLNVVDCILLGLVLGVLGQLGDLFESMLKRSFGVKDSGTLIPGHGGLLDRLDSLLFTFPPAFYYALWRFPHA